MRDSLLKFIFCLLAAAAGFGAARAQTPVETAPIEDENTKAQNLCREIPMKAERTYYFRPLPKAPEKAGIPYGPPKWYQRLFPFLRKDPARENRIDDILTIEKELGRPIPFGETKRSQKIRLESRQKLDELQKQGEQNWELWLKQNPNAGADEIKKAEIRIRYQGLAATAVRRFDWREQGLNVGEVGNQGFGCNTCWAFATVDAMQSSRRLAAMRGGKYELDEDLNASVQQLVSCMLPSVENFCKVNWHGSVFTYLVDKGLPLGGPSLYKADDFKIWTCDSETYVKALTWDFVSFDPRKVSETDEIKRALILYGPVVSMVRFDKCFYLYGGGVFNGENNNTGTHILLIIGWDDAKGAWLVKNSYGKEWGENGFGWIKYGSNNIGESSAWILADPKEEERIAKKPATEAK